MPYLRVREIMDELNTLGTTAAQMVLITELVAVCLAAGPKPPTCDRPATNRKRYVYLAGTADSNLIKIGISLNPWARVSELQTGSPTPFEVLATFVCEASCSERELHELLSCHRHKGEWFNLPEAVKQSIIEFAAEKTSYEELLALLRSSYRMSDVATDVVYNNIKTLQSGKGGWGEKPKTTNSLRLRGTRLPDDWNPSETLWTWGKEKLSPDVLRFETAAFKDFWAAKPGAAGKKLDWDKTWRTWIREAVRRRDRFKPKIVEHQVTGPKRTWDEQKHEVLARLKAEKEQQG